MLSFIRRLFKWLGAENGMSTLQSVAVGGMCVAGVTVAAYAVASNSGALKQQYSSGLQNQTNCFMGNCNQPNGFQTNLESGIAPGYRIDPLTGELIDPNGNMVPGSVLIAAPPGLKSDGNKTGSDQGDNFFKVIGSLKGAADPIIDAGGVLLGGFRTISRDGYTIVYGGRAWTSISTEIGLGDMVAAGRHLRGTILWKSVKGGAFLGGALALGEDLIKLQRGDFDGLSGSQKTSHFGVDIAYGIAQGAVVGAFVGGLIATAPAWPLLLLGLGVIAVGSVVVDMFVGNKVKNALYEPIASGIDKAKNFIGGFFR